MKLLISLALISFLLGGCQKNSEEPNSTSNQALENNTDSTVNTEKSESENTEKFSSVEEFINSPLYAAVLEAAESSGYTITSEGNTLIYTFKQSEQIEITDEIISYLQEENKKQEDTYKESLISIFDAVNTDEITLLLKYVNADESEIYTHEMKITSDNENQIENSSTQQLTPSINNYENYSILKTEVFKDEFEESDALKVTLSFTNNTGETTSFHDFTFIKAYQDGIELDKSYDEKINDNVYKSLRPEATLPIELGWLLLNTTTPVEIEIVDFMTDEVLVSESINLQ